MKLIVGLGNPGNEYAKTRHNAGFMAIDRIADRHALHDTPRARFKSAVVEGSVAGVRCILMKPTTYMNRSGQAVAEAVSFYKLDLAEDLLVLVDDIALPCGQIRLRASGGSGGHNGLSDIKRALGSDAYARCRIGIDPKPPFMDDQADYVLGRFTPDQLAALEPALDKTAEAAECFLKEGVDIAMNRFNVRPTKEKPAPKKKEAKPDQGAASDEDGKGEQGGGDGDPPSVHPGWLAG